MANAKSLETADVIIAKDRFLRLYSGQLVVVKEEIVRTAMTDFRDALLLWEKSPKDKPVIDGATADRLLAMFPDPSNSKRGSLIGSDTRTIEDAIQFLKGKPSNRLEALCLILAESCRRELQQSDRDPLYAALADDFSNLIFHAELTQEWFANNWTSLEELKTVVPDYNTIIVKVRMQEHSRRPLLIRYWSVDIASRYDRVMQAIKELDSAIHQLNRETGAVVHGEKDRADDKVAKEVATAVAQQLKLTKPLVNDFLNQLSIEELSSTRNR